MWRFNMIGAIWSPSRFSAVPWLDTMIDLRPMGAPERIVDPGCGTTVQHWLVIPVPWGKGTDAWLYIRTTRGNGNDGGVITLAYDEGTDGEAV